MAGAKVVIEILPTTTAKDTVGGLHQSPKQKPSDRHGQSRPAGVNWFKC
ncbi:hypothetical protein [Synechocystis salina]|nr:hypothetical protein [Synechocystis salina]